MKKAKIAVIGTGFWGMNHIRVLSDLENVELVAACDINEEKTNIVKEKYGIKTYKNSRKMLGQEKIDAVTICVWSTLLAREAFRAIKERKHVFVEKPMAKSVREAKKILAYAESNKSILTVGFIERFNPGTRRLKEVIMNETIGSIVLAVVKRVSKWPKRIGDIGVVKDTAIHDIDITRYIFGEDPTAVYATTGHLLHDKFEDYAQIMLSFSKGRSAFLEANWLTPYKIRKLIVTGSEAILSLDYITQEITIETSGQTITPRFDWEEPLKLELNNFVDSLLGERKPLVSGLDGLKALVIAEAALKSARQNKLVKLSF